MAAFMRYFRAKETEDMQSAAFRLYVGTGVQYLVENTAAFVGNTRVLTDFVSFIGLKKPDNRTGDEIAEDIIRRAGLKVNHESI